VKREAARYGVQPVSSEIVGLIPKRALEDAAEWFLQIENFEPTMILENRMAAVMGGTMAPGGPAAGLRAGVEPFIEQLAAPTAAPGGGSAAAATAAMAAALGAMVAGMSRGKKAYAHQERALSEAIARLDSLRAELKAAIDADAQAFTAIMQAHRAQREGKANLEQVHEATRHGIEVPLRVAEQADEIRGTLASLRPITNPNMASDLTTGEALARAAAQGAIANVEINAESFNDETFRAVYRARAAELKERNR
jgi:formiminotetrahydrofolate cyclodeaminase